MLEDIPPLSSVVDRGNLTIGNAVVVHASDVPPHHTTPSWNPGRDPANEITGRFFKRPLVRQRSSTSTRRPIWVHPERGV